MIILLFGVRGITSGLLRDSALMAFALHYCKVLSTPFVSSGQRRVVGLMKRIFETAVPCEHLGMVRRLGMDGK